MLQSHVTVPDELATPVSRQASRQECQHWSRRREVAQVTRLKLQQMLAELRGAVREVVSRTRTQGETEAATVSMVARPRTPAERAVEAVLEEQGACWTEVQVSRRPSLVPR